MSESGLRLPRRRYLSRFTARSDRPALPRTSRSPLRRRSLQSWDLLSGGSGKPASARVVSAAPQDFSSTKYRCAMTVIVTVAGKFFRRRLAIDMRYLDEGVYVTRVYVRHTGFSVQGFAGLASCFVGIRGAGAGAEDCSARAVVMKRIPSAYQLELCRDLPSRLTVSKLDADARCGPHHDRIVFDLAYRADITGPYFRTLLASD
jgi:hypothetical protein